MGAVTGDGLSGSEIGLTGPGSLSNLRTFVRQQNVLLTCTFRSAILYKRPCINQGDSASGASGRRSSTVVPGASVSMTDAEPLWVRAT